jgi:hypothetical protein
VGILLQRSADGGPWEDVTVLPAGTTIYTDTDVLDDTSYAYRVQVLDSAGNDSDFTTTPASGRSLPALPQPPTLHSVTAVAADALTLAWSSPAGDVVTGYRIERSGSAGGRFEVVLQTGGGITLTHDTGLAPGTTYYYRVVALNDTGASNPSAVRSGTTRRLTLAAPQNVRATLLPDGRVEITWAAGPNAASTVLEYTEGGADEYLPLATTGASGPYSHYPGEPNTYAYRLKFVLGDAESAYTETGVVVIEERQLIYLPLVVARQCPIPSTPPTATCSANSRPWHPPIPPSPATWSSATRSTARATSSPSRSLTTSPPRRTSRPGPSPASSTAASKWGCASSSTWPRSWPMSTAPILTSRTG